MRGFEDLIAWQGARELARWIYGCTTVKIIGGLRAFALPQSLCLSPQSF